MPQRLDIPGVEGADITEGGVRLIAFRFYLEPNLEHNLGSPSELSWRQPVTDAGFPQRCVLATTDDTPDMLTEGGVRPITRTHQLLYVFISIIKHPL